MDILDADLITQFIEEAKDIIWLEQTDADQIQMAFRKELPDYEHIDNQNITLNTMKKYITDHNMINADNVDKFITLYIRDPLLYHRKIIAYIILTFKPSFKIILNMSKYKLCTLHNMNAILSLYSDNDKIAFITQNNCNMPLSFAHSQYNPSFRHLMKLCAKYDVNIFDKYKVILESNVEFEYTSKYISILQQYKTACFSASLRGSWIIACTYT